jgi:hypothetical protein
MGKHDYTIELLDPGGDDLYGLSCDMFVRFPTRGTYAGTLFTPEGIVHVMDKWGQTGECAHGSYFYCLPDLLVVRRLDETIVRSAIDELLENGVFEQIFVKSDEK